LRHVLALSRESTKPSADKSHRVAPAELEGLLVGHEKVADACVLGIYDPDQATEVPRAYVVKAEGFQNVDDSTLEREIREWLEVKVASHKKLRGGVRFVDEIPKSAPGKILRRILRDKMKIEEAEKNKSKPKL
jgi:4-coumarate--CoA ligase